MGPIQRPHLQPQKKTGASKAAHSLEDGKGDAEERRQRGECSARHTAYPDIRFSRANHVLTRMSLSSSTKSYGGMKGGEWGTNHPIWRWKNQRGERERDAEGDTHTHRDREKEEEVIT